MSDLSTEKPPRKKRSRVRTWFRRIILATVVIIFLFLGWELSPNLMPIGAGLTWTGDTGRVGQASSAVVTRECLNGDLNSNINVYYWIFKLNSLILNIQSIFSSDPEITTATA